MIEKTVIKADLAEAVHQAVGLSKAESTQLVTSLFEIMAKALISGEDVKMASFASFLLRDKKDRLGRNPKTGEKAKISSRRVVAFRPSDRLRASVNS